MPTGKRSFLHLHNSLVIGLFLLVSTACNPKLPKISDENRNGSPGSGRDEHNCLSSAGYSRSALRNECIRFWEVGIELTDARNASASHVAYIITATDISDIELILPYNGKISFIKKGENWVDSKNRYSLSKSKEGIYQLHNTRGILLYQSGKS